MVGDVFGRRQLGETATFDRVFSGIKNAYQLFLACHGNATSDNRTPNLIRMTLETKNVHYEISFAVDFKTKRNNNIF